MKSWKVAALAVGIAAATGAAMALAPTAKAQGNRAAEVFTFAGSGRLGVSISDVDAADVKGKTSGGVVVDEVEQESPAAKAGFRKGDIIVEFDGERVRSVRQFTRLVSETPPGRTVSAAVLRDGQRVTLSATPRESNTFRFFEGDHDWVSITPPAVRVRPPAVRPPTPPPTPDYPRAFEPFLWRSGSRLGVTTQELSTQLAEYFGTKDGVLVTSVETDSAAAKAGVKAGDVITSVNGSSVESSADLRRRLSNLGGGDEFSLAIMRDKKPLTLKGKIEGTTERRRTTRTII